MIRRWATRLSRVAGIRVHYWVAFLVVVVPTAVVTVVAVPVKVTVDGIIYISSAKSLFTTALATDYGWFREPGYPFVLWLIHEVSPTSIMIELVQALFLGISCFIALYTVTRRTDSVGVSVGQLALMTLIALNPMFLIYAGLVLQQALFAFQLALFGLGVSWAILRPRWLSRWILIPVVLVEYAAAIWTSVGWIYLGLFPVALTIVAAFWPQLRKWFAAARSRARRALVAVGALTAAVVLLLLLFTGGNRVYGGWEAFKAPYVAKTSTGSYVIKPLSSAPALPNPLQFSHLLLTLMHIAPDSRYEMENDLFFRQQMVIRLPIAQYDTAYVAKPFTDYAPGYFSLSDSPAIPHAIYSVFAKAGPAAYTGVFIGFIISLLAILVRRRWSTLLVMLVPWSFLAVYAASDSPIDRYGVPAFPWAGAGVVLLATWAVEFVRWRRARRTARSTPEPVDSAASSVS